MKLLKALVLAVSVLFSSCAHKEQIVAAPPPPVQKKENTVATLIKEYRLAIVAISHGPSSCTGFHIGNGVIITAHHCKNPLVAEDILVADAIKRIHSSTILAESEKYDILVLSIPTKLLPTVQLEENGIKELMEGEQIFSMGFPGYFDPNFTFDVGWYKGYIVLDEVNLLIISDASASGYSGGPVISVKSGKVIGVQHMLGSKVEDFVSDNRGINTIRDHWQGLVVDSGHLIKLLEDNKINFKSEIQ